MILLKSKSNIETKYRRLFGRILPGSLWLLTITVAVSFHSVLLYSNQMLKIWSNKRIDIETPVDIKLINIEVW